MQCPASWMGVRGIEGLSIKGKWGAGSRLCTPILVCPRYQQTITYIIPNRGSKSLGFPNLFSPQLVQDTRLLFSISPGHHGSAPCLYCNRCTTAHECTSHNCNPSRRVRSEDHHNRRDRGQHVACQ